MNEMKGEISFIKDLLLQYAPKKKKSKQPKGGANTSRVQSDNPYLTNGSAASDANDECSIDKEESASAAAQRGAAGSVEAIDRE